MTEPNFPRPAPKRYRQEAPYPEILADLISRLHYRPGWRFDLTDIERDEDHGRGRSAGLTLMIVTHGYDSYHQDRGESYRVQHFFPVPPCTYDERSWQRWLLERVLDVERHEACEFFALERGHRLGGERIFERPYGPSHGPGNDPYLIREVGTDLDRRTRFTGQVVR